MTRTQELAVSLGWDFEKAEKLKTSDNTFNSHGIKKNRRINSDYSNINHDRFYNHVVYELNAILKGESNV